MRVLSAFRRSSTPRALAPAPRASSPSRRAGLWRASTALALSLLLPWAGAQADWPERSLKLVIPFPPGGAADTIGRYYADQLGQRLGQTVVVENKPGAGTAIAAESVARAAPDGYTLSLATSGQLTILPHLQPELRFDPVRDFAPVSLVGAVPNVIAVQAQSEITTLDELLAAARANPGGVSVSSCGVGTLCHLSGELLQSLTDTDLLHVPYQGSAPAVTALLGGDVVASVDTLTILAPHIRAGKLRGLVLGTPERSSLLPEVPSATDVGLPDFSASGWFGVVVPAATPPAVVQRLQQDIAAIATAPQTGEFFDARGITVAHNTPEAFATLIADDQQRWGAVVKAAQLNQP